MLRIVTFLAALVVTASPAVADAVRDCAADDHGLAIPACTLLIEQNPRNAVAHFNRAISYRETGKLDLAMADYTRAIEINPKYFLAYNNRGNLYIGRGDNKRALQDFEAAIKINPKYAIAHNNSGEALENMNLLEDAMVAYNKAIAINPRYARAIANRGDIWRKMKQPGNAIADYRHALTIDRKNGLALAGLKILGIDAPEAGEQLAALPTQVASTEEKDGSVDGREGEDRHSAEPPIRDQTPSRDDRRLRQ